MRDVIPQISAAEYVETLLNDRLPKLLIPERCVHYRPHVSRGCYAARTGVGCRCHSKAQLLAGRFGDKMSMILETSAEPGFLRAGAIGEFSLDEAKRTFLELLEAVARQKVKKVLFDGRRLTGEPEGMERFYYGEFAAKAVRRFADCGVSPVTQFAYVLEEPVLDPRRFGESVAVNRGMCVKTFDNVDDALRWLGMAPANKPDAGDGR